MNREFYKLIIVTLIFLVGCGDPTVSLEDVKYEPKIAVEGILYPEEPVNKIWIMRNVPLNTVVENDMLYLTPDGNGVTASINGVALHYNSVEKYYYTNDLSVEYGKEYTLVVDAVIDGNNLHTEISTTTPLQGFKVINHDLGEIIYRQTSPKIDFYPSPEIGFYAFSIVALDASFDTFIFDNPYIPNLDSADLADDFNGFKYEYNLLLNVDSNPGTLHSYNIYGLDTWFYGNYRVTVYACDKNMKDYVLTAGDVMEFDGNLHEPRNYFSEDGIGVFGSAIKETVLFQLLPRE